MIQHGSNKYAELDEIAFALTTPSRFREFTLRYCKTSPNGSNNLYLYIKGNRYRLNVKWDLLIHCYNCKLFQNNSRAARNWFNAVTAQEAVKRCMELFFDYIDSFDRCCNMFRAYVPGVVMVAGEDGVEAHFPQALTPAEMELISAECKFRVDKYEWISPKQINVFYTPQP